MNNTAGELQILSEEMLTKKGSRLEQGVLLGGVKAETPTNVKNPRENGTNKVECCFCGKIRFFVLYFFKRIELAGKAV